MKEYCVEFFKEHDIVACQAMLDDLDSIDRNLELETRWMAQKLSGVDDSEPSGFNYVPNLADVGMEVCQGSLTMIRKAHAETPWLRFIRPYHIAEVQGVPGLKKLDPSRKNKRTKYEEINMALRRLGDTPYFRRSDNGFAKLLVDI